MPHLQYMKRYWRVATDEVSVPALCSMVGRVTWTALISIVLGFCYESLVTCPHGWVLLLYLFCSIFLFGCSIVCEVLLVSVSLQGSIVEIEKRHGINKYLTIHIILSGLQLICAIFGIISLSLHSTIPCQSEYSNSLNKLFVSIVVISQLIDIFIVCCCGYLFSANRIEANHDHDVHPRDETWALNTWEKRCRAMTKSLQVCTCNLFGGSNITEGFEEVAKVLTNFFHHEGFLDVVPSDVAAGVVLVRLEQRILRRAEMRRSVNPLRQSLEMGSDSNLHGRDVSSNGNGLGLSTPERRPSNPTSSHSPMTAAVIAASGSVCSLEELEVMTRAMLFSLAIYTHLMVVYMRPCTGLCKMCCCGCFTCRPHRYCCLNNSLKRDADHTVIKGDNCCRMHNAGLEVITQELVNAEVLFVSFSNNTASKPYGVFLDHEQQLVIIAIRGTLSLEDCITDGMADPIELTSAGVTWGFEGAGRWAHGGMLNAAQYIRTELETTNVLNKVFGLKGFESKLGTPINKTYSHYQLIVSGHSLGAGTACILALLLRRTFPNLRCFAFGNPASVFDRQSAQEYASFITTVVLGNDMVTRMNFKSICALRAEVLHAISRAKVNKMFIMQSIFKDFAPEDLMYPKGEEPESEFKESIRKFENSIQSRMESLGHTELCLPGRIIHLAKIGQEKQCGFTVSKYLLKEAQMDDFTRIQVSTTMGADHLPDRYYFELGRMLQLQRDHQKEREQHE